MSGSTSLYSAKVKKIYILSFIFSLILIFACARWQIVNASYFEDIQRSKIDRKEIDSMRGTIYSSDGSTLALSEPRFDIYIWMKDLNFFEEKGLQTREEFLNKVAPLIDTTEEEMEKTINETYKPGKVEWFKIADNISADRWTDLMELKTDKNHNRPLRGFDYEYTAERNYPEENLASQVIGLTTQYKDKTIGQSGLESYWDGILNPIKGFQIQEDNAIGQAIPTALLPTIEPKNGSAIYTSIDKKLQKIVEDKIEEGVKKYEAVSGTVIVMDPKTGQIMALANYPDFNPNKRDGDEKNYGNIAISSPYETGSTGKTLTLAAAIDLGVATEDTLVLPEGHQGCEKIHRDLLPVCTWNQKPQGPMPISECYVKSDNLCFYHLAKLMEKQDFYNYLKNFGVGQPTGVDMGGESHGQLKTSDEWNTADVAAFSYGHGYLMNSLQSITATAVIANKGVRMKPYVVTKVVDSNGEVNEYKPIQVQRVVSEDTADRVAKMMHDVYQANIGTWEYWYDPLRSYNISMKSGTALIATKDGYIDDINGSYIGFDNSPDKKFIMLIKLEKPQIPANDKLSFYNARLVWLDTFDAIKDHLGVPMK